MLKCKKCGKRRTPNCKKDDYYQRGCLCAVCHFIEESKKAEKKGGEE